MCRYYIWIPLSLILSTFQKKKFDQNKTFDQAKKNTLVSRNASNESLHPGGRQFFLINLIEFLK